MLWQLQWVLTCWYLYEFFNWIGFRLNEEIDGAVIGTFFVEEWMIFCVWRWQDDIGVSKNCRCIVIWVVFKVGCYLKGNNQSQSWHTAHSREQSTFCKRFCYQTEPFCPFARYLITVSVLRPAVVIAVPIKRVPKTTESTLRVHSEYSYGHPWSLCPLKHRRVAIVEPENLGLL